MLFTQTLVILGIQKLPFPVFGLVQLFCRFRMAGQTGTGHLGPGLEILVELLEFAVVRSSGGSRELTEEEHKRDEADL